MAKSEKKQEVYLESIKAKELEEDFKKELTKTLECLCDAYPRVSRVKEYKDLTENDFKMVVFTVLLNNLRELQYDSTKINMRDFHRKYTPNLQILYRCDFTGDEFLKIIDDSYLTPCDKAIARKFFIEKKTRNEVHSDEDINKEIGDIKTVNTHLAEEINNALLYRACIYNKENKN